jgi:hypothetical protein
VTPSSRAEASGNECLLPVSEAMLKRCLMY